MPGLNSQPAQQATSLLNEATAPQENFLASTAQPASLASIAGLPGLATRSLGSLGTFWALNGHSPDWPDSQLFCWDSTLSAHTLSLLDPTD